MLLLVVGFFSLLFLSCYYFLNCLNRRRWGHEHGIENVKERKKEIKNHTKVAWQLEWEKKRSNFKPLKAAKRARDEKHKRIDTGSRDSPALWIGMDGNDGVNNFNICLKLYMSVYMMDLEIAASESAIIAVTCSHWRQSNERTFESKPFRIIVGDGNAVLYLPWMCVCVLPTAIHAP